MSKITVTPVSDKLITSLPDAWKIEDYKAIIAQIEGEYQEMPDSEIEEYVGMLIADMEVSESAHELLTYKLSDRLSDGQIKNLSNEMDQDKMWEEFSDMACHKDIFNVNYLLYKSYNGKVPKGQAMVLELIATSKDPQTIGLLLDSDPDAILRIIIGGTDSHSKLHRLYDGAEMKDYIDDASSILWDIEVEKLTEQEVKLTIISSEYWLQSFDTDNSFEVTIDMDVYDEDE